MPSDASLSPHRLLEGSEGARLPPGAQELVLVVGGVAAYVAGVDLWLGTGLPDVRVRSLVGDARDALLACVSERPAVLVLADGLDPYGVLDGPSGWRVLVLAEDASLGGEVDLIRAGAAGVLSRATDRVSLVRSVGDLLAGRSVASAEAIRYLAAGAPAGGTLTARQREILALVEDGLTTAQIAAELVVSQSTVKTHLRRIRARVGTPLVRGARRGGLLRAAPVTLEATSSSPLDLSRATATSPNGRVHVHPAER